MLHWWLLEGVGLHGLDDLLGFLVDLGLCGLWFLLFGGVEGLDEDGTTGSDLLEHCISISIACSDLKLIHENNTLTDVSIAGRTVIPNLADNLIMLGFTEVKLLVEVRGLTIEVSNLGLERFATHEDLDVELWVTNETATLCLLEEHILNFDFEVFWSLHFLFLKFIFIFDRFNLS